jgi:hypothetical protein
MYSSDVVSVHVYDVDRLHATVDSNAPVPDHRRLTLYQALVVESEVARLLYQHGGAALLTSQFGGLSATRIASLSTSRFGERMAFKAQHHVLGRHV